MIHSTAVIHPDAVLGANVSVGPYAVIEGAAKIGDGCVIQAHAIITAHVEMGRDNLIGYGAIIGGDPQDFAFKPEVRSLVRIGDGNKIREYSTIHRGTTENSATTVGHGCFLMAGAHLAHNVTLGDHVILANNVLLGGHVQIAERVFIGGGCVFHQHIRAGRLVICQGGSAFSKDIPPFTTAAERGGGVERRRLAARRPHEGAAGGNQGRLRIALPPRLEYDAGAGCGPRPLVGAGSPFVFCFCRGGEEARHLRFAGHPRWPHW